MDGVLIDSKKNMQVACNKCREVFDFNNLKKHKIVFLLTPNEASEEQEKYFIKIHSSLNNLNLPNQNTFPNLKNLVGIERQRSDWANLADSHPGLRQTPCTNFFS